MGGGQPFFHVFEYFLAEVVDDGEVPGVFDALLAIGQDARGLIGDGLEIVGLPGTAGDVAESFQEADGDSRIGPGVLPNLVERGIQGEAEGGGFEQDASDAVLILEAARKVPGRSFPPSPPP